MFTGIIHRFARVAAVSSGTGFTRLDLAADLDDVREGESIAVNGCCLTVAAMSNGRLSFDVVPETLSRTNLGLLTEGDAVHVERSLRVGDRIDGHFVQGHVDGRALLIETLTGNDEFRLRLEVPHDLAKYLTPKGSVCLDGVSLTVARLEGNHFEVALIPTTLRRTALAERRRGWPFNFEADVLGKAVVHWLETYHRRPTDDGGKDA